MASSYIDTAERPGYGRRRDPGHSWAEHTAERLRWAYGEARAKQILSGKDPNTIRDRAAWNRLCALAKGEAA